MMIMILFDIYFIKYDIQVAMRMVQCRSRRLIYICSVIIAIGVITITNAIAANAIDIAAVIVVAVIIIP